MKKNINILARRLFPQQYYRYVVASRINVVYYQQQSGLTSNNPKKLTAHYLETGYKENLNPTLYFSTQHYLERNPDVREASLNPFVHYILYGQSERRGTGMLPAASPKSSFSHAEIINNLNLVDGVIALKSHFDFKYYQKQTATQFSHPEAAIIHYIEEGEKNGLSPHPAFDTKFYLQDNPDLINAEFCLYLHYILHGQNEGREANNGYINHYKKQAASIRPEFDVEYYESQNPNYIKFSSDPIINFLQDGYKQGLNPNHEFNSSFYRATNPDLEIAGMNGFVHYVRHGRDERRTPQSYFSNLENFKPLISVIIPNYNHAAYLEKRIQSVAEQTYGNIEILILDDCSTDNSKEVIENCTDKYPHLKIRLLFNKKNSGGVFKQWQKGIKNANGDYIWICESDDFCELDFLENLVPHFADKSVNIAFGKIHFSDKSGQRIDGMDHYRESSEAGIWEHSLKRPAKAWFNNGFGINNLISNVGGCVFRKTELSSTIWREATKYEIAGDWYLYLHIAGGGQIIFEPKSVSYFRQHGKNTSASNFDKLYFYDELKRVFDVIDHYWQTPSVTREKFLINVESNFNHWKMHEQGFEFDKIFNAPPITKPKRKPHILVGFLGFVSGGGEVFAINQANALQAKGYLVSMLAIEMHDINPKMYKKLHPSIAVYSMANLALMGRKNFFETVGIGLVHSTVLGIESLLFELDRNNKIEVPYVVTLHGSYDGLDVKLPEVRSLLNLCYENVTYWVHTADKNLKVFKNTGFKPERIERIDNAMPIDLTPYPKTRSELGIKDTAFVFAFVARGIEGKGWSIAINAFQKLQKKLTDQNIHLIMVGDGDAAEKTVKKIRKSDNITYLSYQSEINGIYRISDCALVPTRFVGESSPLCIIQALQENIPIIATDHGDIKNNLTVKTKRAGHIIEFDKKDSTFTASVSEAMQKICTDNKYRNKLINAIPTIRKKFEMSEMISKYIAVYQKSQKLYNQSKPSETSITNAYD